jgi:2-keto-3-deoxy-L-fuconate dehydrogenase
MTDFDGVVAFVTGAAQGIGAATVAELVRRGARVAAADLREPASAEHVLPLVADVSDDAAVRAAVDRAAAELGGLDVVVNNAGISATGDVAANDDEEWHRVLDVNCVGVVRVTRAALPYLRRSQRPAVVNVSSVAALTGLPHRALYSASKGAVLALTRAMAADLVGDGVRVNAVCPGTVDTPWVGRLLAAADNPEAHRRALEARQPLGRLATAAEIAAAICWLASPANSFSTASGLIVDGGLSGVRLPS